MESAHEPHDPSFSMRSAVLNQNMGYQMGVGSLYEHRILNSIMHIWHSEVSVSVAYHLYSNGHATSMASIHGISRGMLKYEIFEKNITPKSPVLFVARIIPPSTCRAEERGLRNPSGPECTCQLTSQPELDVSLG